MHRVPVSNPQCLEYRGGGGVIGLIGAVVALLGLKHVTSPFTAKVWDAALLFVALPVGCVAVAVGLALVVGRSRVVVDRRRGVATTSWRAFGLGWSAESPLEGRDRVVLSTENRGTGGTIRIVHPVRLVGGAEPPMELRAEGDVPASRLFAEEVAQFLGLKLVDQTQGVELIREGGGVNESVRARMQRLGGPPKAAERPASARSGFEEGPEGPRFELPPPGYGGDTAFCMGVGGSCVVGGVLMLGYVAVTGGVAMTLVGVMLMFGMPAVFFLVPGFLDARRSDRVEATARGLVLTRQRGLTTESFDIPAEELEELEVVKGSLGAVTILARSDERELRFGDGLPEEELSWIRDRLRAALCS